MMKNYPLIFGLLLGLFTFGSSSLFSQELQLAFPGAEGFGRFTTGGRGGVVYEVTNLNNSGPGSFRAGVEMTGARTIVFRVSGTIHLETDLRIRNGNLTIAGQTAPGQGITIKGSGLMIDADNIIIRYLRVRPGDIEARELDAIWGRQNKDIILDHCSLSWSTDEVGSFYDNENFTMQWCILSESLYESVHDKGRHGYGGIWGGVGATFHHNLLAHHSSRNPRFNGARYTTSPETELVDFRNNVIFNWGGNSAYGGEGGNHNMVANYYKAGPATSGDKRFRIINPSYDSTLPWGKWYVEDNVVEGYPDVSADNWNGGVQGPTDAVLAEIRVAEPFPFAPVTTQTADAAFTSVLANAGANYPYQDPVDARITTEVETGQVTYGGAYGAGKGIIDTQATVGGWPELFSAPAPPDTDHDGMPDAWETANNLNSNDATDRNGDADGDGYTNVEEYLNGLLATEPAEFLKHPSAVRVQNITTNSLTIDWNDNTDQETEVILERSPTNGNDYAVLATLPANTTTYVDEGLEPGQVYYYRLRVVSSTMQSAYSTPLAAQTYFEPLAPDQEKLVGYWSFDETSGVAVEDMSVYQAHGEVKEATGATWVAGKHNNALDLAAAGPSAHVLVPHAAQFDFDLNSFSISMWIKGDAETNQAYLLHKGSFVQSTSGGTSGKWYGIELKDGLIRFGIDDNQTKSEVSAPSSDVITGAWVHVVAVRDRASDKLRLYRNGELLAEATDNTNGGLSQSEPIYLGNSSDQNALFTGGLDEVKIYNYALTQAEVAGIHAGFLMQPFNPSPADGMATLAPEEVALSWSGDALSYDVYMGPSADQLALVAEGISATDLLVSQLAPATPYFWRVTAHGEEGNSVEGDTWSYTTGSVTGIRESESLQSLAAYPNPFSDELTLTFDLKRQEVVSIALYDMQNRRVAGLKHAASLAPGVHQVRLSVSDTGMHTLQEGIYLCVVQTSSQRIVSRLIYLKQ